MATAWQTGSERTRLKLVGVKWAEGTLLGVSQMRAGHSTQEKKPHIAESRLQSRYFSHGIQCSEAQEPGKKLRG